jgi:P4 family phage/plasmid primase-like protien
MTDAAGAAPLAPDARMIAAFAAFLFGSSEGWVAVRAFPEKGDASRLPSTPFIPAGADLGARLVEEVVKATRKGLAVYVVPGTVSAPGRAKAADVVAIEIVLVDLDQGDIAGKREHLVRHLGPPSLEVASGGVTPDGQDRLHLHWKLNKPATGADIARVCELRGVIAAKVGGDPSFRSAHQPIRIAGSIYRKGGAQRLVSIRAEQADQYDLADFAERVAKMPAMEGVTDIDGPPPVKLGKVVELFAREVREGGVDGVTRFGALSRIIGYWIRRNRDGHVTREQAWEEIVAYNEARIVPPWPVDRLKQEAHRLWERDAEQRQKDNGDAGGDDAEPPHFTEDSLGLEFTRRHGRDWAYVAAWGQWLVWTGARWERETTLRAFDLARLVCREAAEECEQPAHKKKIASASTVAAVERLARADRTHAAEPDRWDRDPWLLNTPGGVVDLRTGRLQDHDRKLAMTKIATATPVEHCPTWLAFLATITGGDVELQAYLQRVVGYCLTGVTTEHALFFLYGTGANGKSVFVNTIATILGDYATTAPMDMFMATTGERHPTDMAGLRGARLVTAIETEQGRRWAESKLKALTGGDKITARFMRQDFFEFVPQFKLVVAGNHKPSIRNVDEAMRRRLHLIPFTVTIPPAKRDQTLPAKLLAEGEGILAWAIEGCLEWQRAGLRPPPAVAAATNEYFEAEDALGRWLDECCERGSAYSETTSILFAAWKGWAEASGEFVGSKKRFSENLASRGFDPYRDHSARGFRGLRLRDGSRSTTGMEF